MNSKKIANKLLMLNILSSLLTVATVIVILITISIFYESRIDTRITKPIIYLYPETETVVNVKLTNNKILTATYPEYKNSWNVIAKPNGDLIDPVTNKTYYALYWEGQGNYYKMTDKGFVVKGSDTVKFLEEKLSLLGLNEREANEFIVYWLPILQENKYNYIRFALNDEIDKVTPLEVTPKPDTTIRVLMVYKPLDKKITIKEQKITTPTRDGFVLVEWGGTLIK